MSIISWLESGHLFYSAMFWKSIAVFLVLIILEVTGVHTRTRLESKRETPRNHHLDNRTRTQLESKKETPRNHHLDNQTRTRLLPGPDPQQITSPLYSHLDEAAVTERKDQVRSLLELNQLLNQLPYKKNIDQALSGRKIESSGRQLIKVSSRMG